MISQILNNSSIKARKHYPKHSSLGIRQHVLGLVIENEKPNNYFQLLLTITEHCRVM